MLTRTTYYWFTTSPNDAAAFALFRRHYSFRRSRTKSTRPRITCPSKDSIVLVTQDYKALFVWMYLLFHHTDGRRVYCQVFRNESNILSSTLILEACAIAHEKWPNEPFYTYVNPKRVQSRNPGYCFIRAGWQRTRITASGLHEFVLTPEKRANMPTMPPFHSPYANLPLFAELHHVENYLDE